MKQTQECSEQLKKSSARKVEEDLASRKIDMSIEKRKHKDEQETLQIGTMGGKTTVEHCTLWRTELILSGGA